MQVFLDVYQRHSIVAIQHFQDHGWTLNQENKNGSKMSRFRAFQSQSQFCLFYSEATNLYQHWVYGLYMTNMVRNDSENFQSRAIGWVVWEINQ